MEQISLFIILVLLNIIFCLLNHNIYLVLLSFIALFVQNFIVIYDNSDFAPFTILTVLFILLFDIDNLFPGKLVMKRK